MLLIVIILLVLALGGWPGLGLHNYGYGPSGVLGVLLIVVLIILLLGRR
jgi:hypothetical protein